MIEPALANEPMLRTLANDPIEPIDRAEPTEPMLRTELREPIDSSELLEPRLQREADIDGLVICPSCPGCHTLLHEDSVDAFRCGSGDEDGTALAHERTGEREDVGTRIGLEDGEALTDGNPTLGERRRCELHGLGLRHLAFRRTQERHRSCGRVVGREGVRVGAHGDGRLRDAVGCPFGLGQPEGREGDDDVLGGPSGEVSVCAIEDADVAVFGR